MPRHRRQRIVLSLLVIFSLLFQQVAVAAYACDTVSHESNRAAVSTCDLNHGQSAPSKSPLCEKHCVPDSTVLTDAGVSAPALSLPPLLFTLVLNEPSGPVSPGEVVDLIRSDPPPRLRFCSLLI
jgi:hypothetical protein